MAKLFEGKAPVSFEMLQVLWSNVAANHHQLQQVAEDLSAAAVSKASQKRFDDLFKLQDRLFIRARELQESVEKAHLELGLLPPKQYYR